MCDVLLELRVYAAICSWWPDCSEAGNKTELTPEQSMFVFKLFSKEQLMSDATCIVWTTCPYKQRDGLFNPDVREINDIGHFESLADAVLYNTLAWSISQDRTYADTAGESDTLSLMRSVVCYF